MMWVYIVVGNFTHTLGLGRCAWCGEYSVCAGLRRGTWDMSPFRVVGGLVIGQERGFCCYVER